MVTKRTVHTPGPWLARQLDDDGHYDITANNEAALIATTAGWYGDTDPSEANARLLAEAPELLRQLKRLVYFHQTKDTPNTDPWTDAVAAIAKVEGK